MDGIVIGITNKEDENITKNLLDFISDETLKGFRECDIIYDVRLISSNEQQVKEDLVIKWKDKSPASYLRTGNEIISNTKVFDEDRYLSSRKTVIRNLNLIESIEFNHLPNTLLNFNINVSKIEEKDKFQVGDIVEAKSDNIDSHNELWRKGDKGLVYAVTDKSACVKLEGEVLTAGLQALLKTQFKKVD